MGSDLVQWQPAGTGLAGSSRRARCEKCSAEEKESASIPSVEDTPPDLSVQPEEPAASPSPKPRTTFRPLHWKPVIGILVERKPEKEDSPSRGTIVYNNWGNRSEWSSNHKACEEAVDKYGGIPRLIWRDGRSPQDLLKGVHAILVPGGRDLHPKFYGQTADHSKGLNTGPEEFDRFEIEMVKEAMAQGVPVRGICRGMQVLNVAAGGTLIQDIDAHLSRRWPYNRLNHRRGEHGIAILPGSRFAEIIGKETLLVNSLHHQAVDAVAPGFMPVAIAADRIIEAIERISDPTVLGVQFHPEKASDSSTAKPKFFESLVQDARDYLEKLEAPEASPKKRVDPHEAIVELQGKGYRFYRDDDNALLADPKTILGAAQNTKMVISIPEAKGRNSTWVFPTHALFMETVMVESGQAPGTSATQEQLALIDACKRRGIAFHPKEHPDLELRSGMSILFNLRTDALLACKDEKAHGPVKVTVKELEEWLKEPKPKRVGMVAVVGREDSELDKLELGLRALERQGLLLVTNWGKPANRHALSRAAENGYSFSVARRKDYSQTYNTYASFTGELDTVKTKELLLAESGQLEDLPQETGEVLRLVERVEKAGGKFFLKGFLKSSPINFDIEAAWALREKKALLVEHPKQEKGKERVESAEQLRALASLYQEEWKPQGEAGTS